MIKNLIVMDSVEPLKTAMSFVAFNEIFTFAKS